MAKKPPEPWVASAVLQQLYPRSIKDTNGDGVGDLNGIIEKLDYYQNLGITGLWLSPFYPSPMADFGYDIENYCDVDPLFGTLDDFRELIRQAHDREIHILIDLVPNHTSDEHPWFKESKASNDNPKRDWYVWKDPKPDGSPPNNWLSHFGGPAWTFDESTGQYYLHSFLSKQPDLNWDNPLVREQMQKIVEFWLELGVDGFRVDWVVAISKDPEFRDDPINPDFVPGIQSPHEAIIPTYSDNGPNLYEYLNEIAEVLARYKQKFMVTEVYPHKIKKPGPYLSFYERIDPLVCAPLNFAMIFMPWKASAYRKFIDRYLSSMQPGYIPVFSTGNHDTVRAVTRLGKMIAEKQGLGPNPDPEIVSRLGQEAARTMAMMVLTLPGAPLLYCGDEIGLENVDIPPELVIDPFEKNVPGQGHGRDGQRTPIPWDSTPNAGFTQIGVEPWLPIGSDYTRVNVAAQMDDPNSIYNLYKNLIAARMENAALTSGEYESHDIHKGIFAYTRKGKKGEQNFGVLLNFSSHAIDLEVPDVLHGRINISTTAREQVEEIGTHFAIRPHEGILIELSN